MRPRAELVADLELWEHCIDETTPAQLVEMLFAGAPKLPGVVIMNGDRVAGVLSRRVFHDLLSRPFSRELYLKKPIRMSMQALGSDAPFVLSADTPISDAVEAALARPPEHVFEPVIVKQDGGLFVLETDVLLRAQSRILAQANQEKDALLDELRDTVERLKQTQDRLVQAQHQTDEELRVARTLQQAILPAEFPNNPAYRGHAVMRAARMIGGDFYDVFKIDDDRLGIVIADTCGKGVPAALFMVLARDVVEQCAFAGLSPGDCLTAANREIFRRNPLSFFVTMIYGILDVRSGELTYANGGHDNPYLIHAEGGVEHLTSTRRSLVVGMIEDIKYPETTVQLQFADTLVFVTDGIAECVSREGETFGEARLERLLQNSLEHAPDRLAEKLLSAVDEFIGGASLTDDVACVAVQYCPPATAG